MRRILTEKLNGISLELYLHNDHMYQCYFQKGQYLQKCYKVLNNIMQVNISFGNFS